MLDTVALTAISSYFDTQIDPDAPQPASHLGHGTPSAVAAASSPAASLTASLTSNPFFHYGPAVRRYAAPSPALEASSFAINAAEVSDAAATSERVSPIASCASASPLSFLPSPPSPSSVPPPPRSLSHGVPLAFAAAHPRTRLAAESSPAGYCCGGVLVWHRPLQHNAASPALSLGAARGGGGSGGGGERRWWPPRRHRGDSGRSVSAKESCRPSQRGRDLSSSSSGSSSSSSSSNSSCSSASSSRSSSCTGTMAVEPPPPLPAFPLTTVVTERGSVDADRLTGGPPASSPVPAMAKTVVLLHVYDRDEDVNVDGDTVWHLMAPHMWWLERAVRPLGEATEATPREAPAKTGEDVGDEGVMASPTCASSSPATQQHQQQPRLACAIRLFLSPWAMPRRRPRLRCCTTAQHPSAPTLTQPSSPTQPQLHPPSAPLRVTCRWCALAVIELGLCGPHGGDTAAPFSSAAFLAGLALNTSVAARNDRHHPRHPHHRRGRHETHRFPVPAFGRFPVPPLSAALPFPGGRRTIATWRTAAAATVPTRSAAAAEVMTGEPRWLRRPLLELLGLEGVWGRSSIPCGADRVVVGYHGFVAAQSLPPPLLPLHTLDLSFRTELRTLDVMLTTWAATGHLARLCRLSVMGCTQLRTLDWLAALPADTLEELNVCGCEELRDLWPVRRLSALRSLKATQLVQLQRLGWWWSEEEEEGEGERRAHGSSSSVAPVLCRLDALTELDLACSSRRTRGVVDVAWIGTLPSLQRLSLSMPEEEEEGGEGGEGGEGEGRVRRRWAAAPHTTPLASLTACTSLRELRLSFRDGPAAASLPRPPPSPPPSPLVVHRSSRRSRHAVVPPVHDAAALSALDVFASLPFPHLRALEVVGARLTEGFTSWLALGCPRLRELHLTNCRVRFSAAGLRNAQAAAVAAGGREGERLRRPQPSSPPPPSPPLRSLPPAADPGRGGRPRSHDHDDDDAVAQRLRDEQWWFGQLARLDRLRRLSIYHVSGCTSGASLDWVAGCVQLRHLAVRNCRWVLDAYAVHRLPRLRTLNLNATDIDDVTFLRMRDGSIVPDSTSSSSGGSISADGGGGEKQGSRAARVSSPVVTALRRMLSPTASPVIAATPQPSPPSPHQQQQQQQQRRLYPPVALAATLCHLTELVLVDCPFLTDLAPLGALTACRSLCASDHRVTSLHHLTPCRAMERIFLVNYTQLSDVTALRWLSRLREVYITHSSVRDVSWIAQQQQQQQQQESLAEVTAVLPRLEKLTLAHSRLLGSVEALGALPRLRHLDLRDCVALHHLGAPAVARPAHRAAPPQHQQHRQPQTTQEVWASTTSPVGHGVVPVTWSLASVSRTALSLASRAAAALRTALPHRYQPTPTSVSTTAVNTAPMRTVPIPTTTTNIATAAVAAATAPVSLAHCAPTLRFLSLSGCTSLVEAAVLGDLTELQYLHAAFTGLRDVAPLRGCRSLKVLDLTLSPCCRPGADTTSPVAAAAARVLAQLPEELPELEMINRRPVERETGA